MFGMRAIERIERELREIERSLRSMAWDLNEIARLLQDIVVSVPATGISLAQLGGTMGTITGVPVGGSGVFQASPLPVGSSLQKGTGFKFSTTDTSVVLTPDATDSSKVMAVVAAGETLPSFGLTVDAVSASGAALTKTFTIPIIQPVVPATDIDLTQLS